MRRILVVALVLGWAQLSGAEQVSYETPEAAKFLSGLEEVFRPNVVVLPSSEDQKDGVHRYKCDCVVNDETLANVWFHLPAMAETDSFIVSTVASQMCSVAPALKDQRLVVVGSMAKNCEIETHLSGAELQDLLGSQQKSNLRDEPPSDVSSGNNYGMPVNTQKHDFDF